MWAINSDAQVRGVGERNNEWVIIIIYKCEYLLTLYLQITVNGATDTLTSNVVELYYDYEARIWCVQGRVMEGGDVVCAAS